jgi:CRP/FNR family transcriptional regulator
VGADTDGPRDKVWYFKAAPLFAGAGDAVRERLAAASTMRRVRPGQVVYSVGAPATMVYLLKEGQVRLVRSDEGGSEATVAVLGPLDLFGEQSLAGGDAREERAEAMVESLICDIPRADFLAALESSPPLSVALRNLFGRRIRQLESRVTDLVFKDAETRLCTVLVRLAEEHGTIAPNGTAEIPLRLTARDLGHLAGLTRPTASQILSRLRHAGLVEGGARRLRLLGLDELRRRAARPAGPAG